jgi:GDP-D-mannose 3', 5'-epimerase
MGSSNRPDGRRILVTGAGGFIGHHLVSSLVADGHWVRGVDLAHPQYTDSPAHEFVIGDLGSSDFARAACTDVDDVYALAAGVGGGGYLADNQALLFRTNALIDINTIDAAASEGAERLVFASSAFVYPEHLQASADVVGLKEDDAYPAAPHTAYGWEKLMAERLCGHYNDEQLLETRVVRFHNIYGPFAPWTGGRERVTAAICRKVAMAKLTGGDSIEIWGDGRQTRSFCYVSDAVAGLRRVIEADVATPLNVGSEELISIDELARLVMSIAGVDLPLRHVEGPQGVRGRNSDNTLIRSLLGWEPSVSLVDGMTTTYGWIEQQVAAGLGKEPPARQ